MTLLVRDEADIVDAQIAFHLHAGVDFVIATDNRSSDGTTEILERYERAGHLRLLREPGDDMRQDEWVTRMARLASTEHAADWVINSDADEFWWPRSGSLREVFATVPARYGVVRGCWRHYLPRPDDGSFFAERMTVRLAAPAHPGDKQTIHHVHQKVAHRARPDVEVERGNHNAAAPGLEPLRAWHPIEVLHFSLRSVAQMERKGRGGWLRNSEYDAPLHRCSSGRPFWPVGSPTTTTRWRSTARGSRRVSSAGRSRSTHASAMPSVLCVAWMVRSHFPGTCPAGSCSPSDDGRGRKVRRRGGVLAAIDGVVRAEERVRALERRITALERRPTEAVYELARR